MNPFNGPAYWVYLRSRGGTVASAVIHAPSRAAARATARRAYARKGWQVFRVRLSRSRAKLRGMGYPA